MFREHDDAAPPVIRAMVLLSGGLDSVAALHWASEVYDEVRAISFEYGQANRDAEYSAAQRVAGRRGVPWYGCHLGHAVRGDVSLKPATPGLVEPGISRANLPFRNAILLATAAAHADRTWPGQRVHLVIGATLDDARGFPDCRQDFTDPMGLALANAMPAMQMRVIAPWQHFAKGCVLWWCTARPDALADVRDSVSCYAGTRCGTCDPCTLRAAAFAACGIADSDPAPLRMTGGDPSREVRP
jgi:7-cyano-7-deazaguanine synthase